MDIILILAAVAAIFFILKIAFKVLKLALVIAVVLFVLYYLTNHGFLSGIL